MNINSYYVLFDFTSNGDLRICDIKTRGKVKKEMKLQTFLTVFLLVIASLCYEKITIEKLKIEILCSQFDRHY